MLSGDQPTAYEIIGVHPRAPGELLSAAYWMAVEEIREQRELGRRVDEELHLVTRAYEQVASPPVRVGYDISLGITRESLTTKQIARSRWGVFGRKYDVDYYEVAGLDDTAPAELVAEGCRIMRNVYLRAPVHHDRQELLLTWLYDACETLRDPQRRRQYDEQLERERHQPSERAGLPFLVGGLIAFFGSLLPWTRPTRPSALHRSMLDRLTAYVHAQQ